MSVQSSEKSARSPFSTFKLSLLAIIASAWSFILGVTGPSSGFVQNEDLPDVMYNHKIFQPLYVGQTALVHLQIPNESVSWWGLAIQISTPTRFVDESYSHLVERF